MSLLYALQCGTIRTPFEFGNEHVLCSINSFILYLEVHAIYSAPGQTTKKIEKKVQLV